MNRSPEHIFPVVLLLILGAGCAEPEENNQNAVLAYIDQQMAAKDRDADVTWNIEELRELRNKIRKNGIENVEPVGITYFVRNRGTIGERDPHEFLVTIFSVNFRPTRLRVFRESKLVTELPTGRVGETALSSGVATHHVFVYFASAEDDVGSQYAEYPVVRSDVADGPFDVVFIDDAGLSTNPVRLPGTTPVHQRLSHE